MTTPTPEQHNPYGDGTPAGMPQNQYAQAPMPQPKKKKKWPWVVGIIAALAIGGAMVGGGDSDTTTTPGTDTAVTDSADGQATQADNKKKDEKPQTDVAIGETVDFKGMKVTVSNLRAESDVLGSYTCADVDLANDSDKSKHFSQFDFKLHRPSGVIADTTFTGLDMKTLETAELAAGGKTSGAICFDGAPESGENKVEYEGSLFSSTKPTWSATM